MIEAAVQWILCRGDTLTCELWDTPLNPHITEILLCKIKDIWIVLILSLLAICLSRCQNFIDVLFGLVFLLIWCASFLGHLLQITLHPLLFGQCCKINLMYSLAPTTHIGGTCQFWNNLTGKKVTCCKIYSLLSHLRNTIQWQCQSSSAKQQQTFW